MAVVNYYTKKSNNSGMWRSMATKKIVPKKTIVTCVTLILVSLIIFQFSISSSSEINLQILSAKSQGTKDVKINFFSKLDPLQKTEPPGPIRCNRTHNYYDLCSISGPTVLDPTISTFFSLDPTRSNRPKQIEKIRPYPRKWESFVMARINEITLVSGPQSPKCEIRHGVPALIFSAGGYTGNFFHDFNDGFIPLYITVHSLFPNQGIILVISKARDWWVSKYKEILHAFNHTIINLDNDTSTHCFPSATFGLISHGLMTINPKLIPTPKTLTHFRAFLDKAYATRPRAPLPFRPKNQSSLSSLSHKRYNQYEDQGLKFKPRLILASRAGNVGRVLSNQVELKREAEKIGFEVIIFEPGPKIPLHETYELLNSSHAMIGVHGAGLTHLLFMRPGSVFVQVVPLGTGWAAEVCYGKPGKDMGLEYMEYRISVDESSLIERYRKEEMVIKDPERFIGKSWKYEIMDIYLKKQNVKLDLVRFRGHLKKAFRKAKEFMEKEG